MTKCAECGCYYVADLPEEIERHRIRHALWEEMRQPADCPSLQAVASDLNSALLVAQGSPTWKHEHMHRCASALKQEMGYDFVPWPDPHRGKIDLSNPVREGHLFGDDHGSVYGAACFELGVPGGNGIRYWWLKWVWLAPSKRRQGHLMARWGYWMSRYGLIAPDPPISDAMKAFLQRIDWTFPGIDRDAVLKL